MMKVATLGVIGAGRMGKLHVENIRRIRGARLKTVVDPYIDETWANNLGLTTAPNSEALFSDDEIDGVLICSPSSLHTEQIMDAARAGKHVFCEKPIAFDPQSIAETLKVVRQNGVKLQVGFNRRFDSNFKRLKLAVESGRIGRVHSIRITSRDPAPPNIEYLMASGGIFLDMTIHDFDMVRYLSGSEVVEVYAVGAVLIDQTIGDIGDVDTAVTTLKLKNDALAVIDNSRKAVYGYDQRIEVFGSKGSIAVLNETPTQTVLSTSEGVVFDRPVDLMLDRYRDSYLAEINEFIRVILEDKEPPVSGTDGLIPVLIALAARQSLLEGKPVRVEEESASY